MAFRSFKALLCFSLADVALLTTASSVPSPLQLGSISVLSSNDLITNNSVKTSAALLLNSEKHFLVASSSCRDLSEALWSPKNQEFTAGLNSSLAYEVFTGRFPDNQLFWIEPQGNSNNKAPPPPPWDITECSAVDVNGTVHDVSCFDELPTLCTHSAPASNISYADTAAPFQVAQSVGRQTLIGYRDFYTFRFMGVRFAPEPERFTYSTVFDGVGTNYALNPAPECLQAPTNGSTDCLFLNIWTTSLPDTVQPGKKDLKPVMVYIYGGGFTTGSASNPTNDGGNLASRGDIVVVDLAYRLSTLGFLALNDGIHNGNYWISDLIAGLEWVQKYIQDFGGDPSQVTIFGESAGAQSVQALLASPKARGLFHGALLQSNYLEPYIPIPTSYDNFTVPILEETGCANAPNHLECLSAYDAAQLISLKNISNNPVIDNVYLTSSYIDLNNSNSNPTNRVPVVIGVNRDEGGVLGPFFDTTNLTTGIIDISASVDVNSAAILSSGAFPLGTGPDPSNTTLDVFNTTTRIYTDNSFRCSSQFTAYAGVEYGVLPSLWFYQFNRTYQDPAYNMNGVCTAPVTPDHPYGDPSLEYFKCHAGDLANTFGNVARVGFPARDENDMPFTQTIVDYWTAFGRTLDPNPDLDFLKVRGYWNTINQIAVSGAWLPLNTTKPTMMGLQWNGGPLPFNEGEQCAVIGLPLDYLKA